MISLYEFRTRNLEPGIRNPQYGLQNPSMSWGDQGDLPLRRSPLAAPAVFTPALSIFCLKCKNARRLLLEYSRFKTSNLLWLYKNKTLITGVSRRRAPVLKCRRFLSFFQRYIVRDISLTEIYRWLVTLARSLKSYPPF